MRLLAPAAVALLALALFAARPAERTVVRERRVEVPVPVEVPVQVPVVVERIETVAVEEVEKPAVERSATPGVTLVHEKMLFLFERQLRLAPDQRRHFSKVLEERQEEIEAYHREIRASGIFRPREYSRNIREVQAASYARMGTALDPVQARDFQGLVAEGRLGDAVAFTLDPGMAVAE